ncbi:MAG: hypothetical protein AAF810_20040 [Cyanobacteria bacterium P01_D01_bin.36]
MNSHTLSYDDESEIFYLTMYITVLLVAVCVISFITGLAVILAPENKSRIIIFGFIAVLGTVSFNSLLGFGVIKQRVGLTVKRISDREKNKNTPSNFSYINPTLDLRQKRYLYRISGSGEPSIPVSNLDLSGNAIHHTLKEKFSGKQTYPVDLQEEWRQEKERRSVSCILAGLSDEDFFMDIADIASMHVFNLSDSEKKRLNHGIEYLFWLDIYTYMKAWLICSVDSHDGVPMPIKVIGLNCPSRDEPNKSLYTRAFSYISEHLLTHEFAREQLQGSQLAVEKLQGGLKELIQLIDEYDYH